MKPRSLLLTFAAFLLLNSSAAAQDDPKQLPQQKEEQQAKDTFKDILAKAQEEYRLYFKEPKTALEFWVAISFEVQVGKFDIAAFHIDKLLQLPQKEADDDLVKIAEAEGMNTFLRLRLVKEWSKDPGVEAASRKNVDALINRVVSAMETHLSDRERLARFVEGLSDKSPEVRSFSLYQLQRAQHRAAPAIVEALRNAEPEKRAVFKNALASLGPEIVPPLLELFVARDAKEAAEVPFRLDMIWVAKARLDKRFVPYLWHLSSAEQYPKIVRDEAKQALAYILGTSAERLPDAKIALTQLAEDHYQYKVRWPDITEVAERDDPTKQIPIAAYKKWLRNEMGGINAAADVLRADDARLDLGLRFARQALDLDPAYLPAQRLFLALLLEAELTRKPFDGQLDKLPIDKSAPALQQLLSKIDSDLLKSTLERAMQDRNYAVMLPLIDAAGERGDVRLAQTGSGGTPGLLVKLLHYPDRRVQFAAAKALLRMPATQAPVGSARIVDVLRRFLASDYIPKVVVLNVREDDVGQLRQTVKEAGYEAIFAVSLRQAMTLLQATADFDAIIIGDDDKFNQLPYVIAQLRADQDAANLPLLLIADPAKQGEMSALAERTSNTFILPAAWAFKGPELKRQLEDAIKFSVASLPLRKAPQEQQQWLQYQVRRDKGQTLSETERKKMARDSLDWFAQMARGELKGYDLIPAKDALLKALDSEEMAVLALRVLARLPLAEVQYRLASIVLDAKKDSLHVAAAQELTRHIQRHGLALNHDQMTLLQQMERIAELPPALRVELAGVVGTFRTAPRVTGERLLNYVPELIPEQKK